MAGPQGRDHRPSTIDLGHNLGLRVVAEGVETAAALRFLDDAHCDAVQGYFLSRPVPSEALEEVLDADLRATLGARI